MSRALWSLIGGVALTTTLGACSSADDPLIPDATPPVPPDAGTNQMSPDLYLPPQDPTPIAAVLGMVDSLYSSGDGALSFLDLRKRSFLKNPIFNDWFCSPLLTGFGATFYVANGNFCDSLQLFDQKNGSMRKIDLDEGRTGSSRIGPIDLIVSPTGEGIYLLTLSGLFLYDPKTNLLVQKFDFRTLYSVEESRGTTAARMTLFGGLLYIGVNDIGVGDFSFGVPQRSRLLVVDSGENSEPAQIVASVDLPFIAPVSMKPYEKERRIIISCAGLTELDRRLIRKGGLTYLETDTLRVGSGFDDQELGGAPGTLELAGEFGFLHVHRPPNIDIDHPFSEIRRFRPYPFQLERVAPIYRDPGPRRIGSMKWDTRIERLLIARRSSPPAIVLVNAEGERDGEIQTGDFLPVDIE